MVRIDAQWSAQFAIAAELVRRGYSVAFYLGNQRTHDALVRGTSSGNQFPIQVKGFKSRGDVLTGKLDPGNCDELFCIVHVSKAPSPLEFFIATRGELNRIKNPGKPQPKFRSDWVRYRDLLGFRDAWHKLPPP